MGAAVAKGVTPDYFIPEPSAYPIRASVGLLFMAIGATTWINGVFPGPWSLALGFAILIWTLYGWFGTVVGESEGGLYSKKVDTGFRWSMGWFIFSEVMFFAAFFGALFYARVITLPWLGEMDMTGTYLWPDFKSHWPSGGGTTGSPAGFVEPFQTMGPFWIPTINTALLLTSGVTLTLAHHALKANHRGVLNFWMAATIVLGLIFVGCQAYEYYHAYNDLNLKMTSGIFGSTFYMLTGFHGFHVTLGATMLIVILVRCMKGHFTPEKHFAFEAVAWYWHFVDVVWIGLYIVVYWM
jgi:cytochrome c oxidase subunit III